MKRLIFTSNTKHYHKVDGKKYANAFDNTNGIINQLDELMEMKETILFISSCPEDYEKTDNYSSLIFDGLRLSGIDFINYVVLDNRNYLDAERYVKCADLIFLSGGDTCVENDFFKKIGLKELLNDFNGIIVGQSAGSINMASNVYNSPEDGDESEPIYFEGLGLSNVNIEPHFVLDISGFDDMQMYQRNHILEESKVRDIYGLCDGSHILEMDGSITIYGDAYLIKNGVITKICDDKMSYCILDSKGLKYN